ncbi:hypothetical protein [Photobacterium sp. 1_MG-2023]|uniref:hypothetical protein n=1 Tax=Photobacterium sp. 1_MG-2023 TaxID=3062646 RepID=UPI0026E47306|nr:hypothetical protein [Photobacterium sp. 1_MG-2023]MDO6709011.1 hypothetical protein [Photobacterium sp. 1_MG-2023]
MKINKVFTLSLIILSINCKAKEVINDYQYQLVCNDLHQGKMIHGDFDAYPEYEMDDGYSGVVDVSIKDGSILIIQDDKFIVSRKIVTEYVEFDNSGEILVKVRDGYYYTFLLNKDPALVNVVNIENKGDEDAFFECYNIDYMEKFHKLEDYIIYIKNNIKIN